MAAAASGAASRLDGGSGPARGPRNRPKRSAPAFLLRTGRGRLPDRSSLPACHFLRAGDELADLSRRRSLGRRRQHGSRVAADPAAGVAGVYGCLGIVAGAATVMTLMSESYGADIRLVAFMQYLRVVVVALVATLIARLWAAPGSHPALPVDWFPHVVWPSLAATIVLIVAGAVAGRALRIPAGPMLVPMVVGTVLQDAGILKIELPPLLLALAYLVVGWSIGLRFSRPILIYAAKAFPRVLASILVLIASCGGLAMMLVALAHLDPLTAYLATSPGGADSVAIIAASTKVNVPFVMGMQIARFVFVLLTGPCIARLIADRAQKRPIGAPIEPAETAR
jgi:membrane AbrB-like protein